MNKIEFLKLLRKKLSNLPKEEVEERITFYSEMIDDQIEEGIPEEEVISKISTSSNFQDLDNSKDKQINKRRLSAAEIILLAIGSPVWFPVLLTLFISVFAILFSVVISFWAAFVSFTACSIAGILFSIHLFIIGNALTGLAILGASLVLISLSILFFYISKLSTNGSISLCKNTFKSIKKKKEEA